VIRTESLQESVATELQLADDEALALQKLGNQLASKRTWWGAAQADATELAEEDQETAREASVLTVTPSLPGKWRVRVNDAVGVVSIGSLQLLIQPKIPLAHLLFLFEKARSFPPRLEEQRAEVAGSLSLWGLVARWFVDELERVLRLDLIRDYLDVEDEVQAARGRIDPLGTARLFYAGLPALACEFDEFGLDTPLNRVLKAGAGTVARSPLLDRDLRQRSIRLLARMDEVGDLRPTDTAVRGDRRTGHYASSLILARHLLQGEGRTLVAGGELAWTFLIRTPEMVEAGIREILAERLGSTYVQKVGRQAKGSKLTFNPDLVFGDGYAVGDVKYKLSTGDWTRADLYQSIAFAEAFETHRGCVIRFRRLAVGAVEDVTVGSKTIHEVTWLADDDVSAKSAASDMAGQVEAWLEMTKALAA
jgi:5-methylcytosine-specific restriction enzyme subunit McrC